MLTLIRTVRSQTSLIGLRSRPLLAYRLKWQAEPAQLAIKIDVKRRSKASLCRHLIFDSRSAQDRRAARRSCRGDRAPAQRLLRKTKGKCCPAAAECATKNIKELTTYHKRSVTKVGAVIGVADLVPRLLRHLGQDVLATGTRRLAQALAEQVTERADQPRSAVAMPTSGRGDFSMCKKCRARAQLTAA